MTTLLEATKAFLNNVEKSRSANTARIYSSVLIATHGHGFLPFIRKRVKPSDPVDKLTEAHAMEYMESLLDMSAASRQLHSVAIRRFYRFIAGHGWAEVSLDRLNFLMDGANVLEKVQKHVTYDGAKVKAFLDWVYAWVPNGNTQRRHLMGMRDRAFVLTLAESGLRVHEACKLKIKDVNFDKGVGEVIGKGNKQARFRIGDRAIEATRAYLQMRDGVVPMDRNQPVFARHDRRVNGIHPILTQTGQAIVHGLEKRSSGEQTITCHTLRHRFVTHVLRETKNLKAAQELARHTNINVTERYAHLADDELTSEFDKAFNVP